MIIIRSFLTSKVLQVFDESSFRNFAIATTLQLTSSESQLLQWQSMAIRVYRRLVKALEPWVRLLKLFRRQPSFGVNNYLFILMKLNSTIVFAERERENHFLELWRKWVIRLCNAHCASSTVKVFPWKSHRKAFKFVWSSSSNRFKELHSMSPSVVSRDSAAFTNG